ncbi:MAG TPA: flagellar motor protein MotB [Ruminiclostridium sp.]|nr:flagellar motor protein MotB [Ruminiclostridium sp.]
MAKEKVVKDNAERWLLTYADLMNLLLILFIILFAMSQVSTEKFQQLSKSLSSAFGNGEPPSVVQGSDSGNSLINFPATMPSPVIPSKLEDQQMEALEEQINSLVDSQGLKGDVSVTMQDRGIVVTINEKILFKSGSAKIEPDDQDTLIRIGKDILSKIPDKHIRVEGHTDNIPMSSVLYASNWELSSARAINVLKLLVAKCGINPKMITPVPYGEYTPLVPNTSDANRAKNRRVDIVILRDSSSKGEADTDNEKTISNATK